MTDSAPAKNPPSRGNKILYLITVDWFFCSHFLERAKAARKAGYKVTVVTHVTDRCCTALKNDFNLVEWRIARRGIRPWRELKAIIQLYSIYKQEAPTLVHHIALKPIVYGTLIARLTGIRHIVNAPVGLGFAFASRSMFALVVRPVVRLALRFFLNPSQSCVIFENEDDLGSAVKGGLARRDASLLIRGAGVDPDAFQNQCEPAGPIRVVMIARMLWDKGVREFVTAARLARERGVDADWVLVGAPDPDNLSSIRIEQLRQWHADGAITWLGHRDDIADILASSHIAVLPSYREGLPKSLLEAMAAGRPVVTTNVPGCRSLVMERQTGLLVPPRDAQAIVDAVVRLIADPQTRRRYGHAGRQRVIEQFSTAVVEKATLDLYAAMLNAQDQETC